MHLFRFLVELFSPGCDVLCPCQFSIEMHAQVFHFIFFGGVGGKSILPICSVGQVCLCRVNVLYLRNTDAYLIMQER
jgi:hypothetical protein